MFSFSRWRDSLVINPRKSFRLALPVLFMLSKRPGLGRPPPRRSVFVSRPTRTMTVCLIALTSSRSSTSTTSLTMSVSLFVSLPRASTVPFSVSPRKNEPARVLFLGALFFLRLCVAFAPAPSCSFGEYVSFDVDHSRFATFFARVSELLELVMLSSRLRFCVGSDAVDVAAASAYDVPSVLFVWSSCRSCCSRANVWRRSRCAARYVSTLVMLSVCHSLKTVAWCSSMPSSFIERFSRPVLVRAGSGRRG